MPRARLLIDWTLYRCLLALIAPWIPLRLWWRGRREPGYRAHWRERLGRLPADVPTQALWVHAVSLGETRAAAPLITALRERFPDAPLVVTCMTATGRAAAETLYGEFARVVFLPYDYAAAMRRFLQRLQPRAGVLMETELWPNLLRLAAARSIPLVLANARLSERSARGYARLPALTRASLSRLAGVAAQSGADAERLTALGAGAVQVCGNLKFDNTPPAELLARGRGWRAVWGGRHVVLAASTREGEEALLLDALDCVPADAVLVLVPRHPQRFDAVADLLAARGIAFVRHRSHGAQPLTAATRVLLGDSVGELYAWYAAADLAFIGGSLVPRGGQNLIEAAAAACPVLIGPHTFNFSAASDAALAVGAALRVDDAPAWAAAVTRLLADPAARRAMGAAGQRYAAAHRGAAACISTLLADVLAARDDGARRP